MRIVLDEIIDDGTSVEEIVPWPPTARCPSRWIIGAEEEM
jgi:hypothetical protein